MDISTLFVRGFIKVISKWGSFDSILFHSGANVILKWGRDSYFKVRQCLFQSGAIIWKWGKSYFKVGHMWTFSVLGPGWSKVSVWHPLSLLESKLDSSSTWRNKYPDLWSSSLEDYISTDNMLVRLCKQAISGGIKQLS